MNKRTMRRNGPYKTTAEIVAMSDSMTSARIESLKNLGIDQKVADSVNSPELLASNNNIATLEAIINLVLEQNLPSLKQIDSLMKHVADMLSYCQSNLNSTDWEALFEHIKGVEEDIAKINDGFDAVNTVTSLMEIQRKQRLAEITRRVSAGTMIPVASVQQMFYELLELVRTQVPPDKYHAIYEQFRRIMAHPPAR